MVQVLVSCPTSGKTHDGCGVLGNHESVSEKSCVFHTRCPIAIEDCKRIVPEWRNVGAQAKEHWVACIRV